MELRSKKLYGDKADFLAIVNKALKKNKQRLLAEANRHRGRIRRVYQSPSLTLDKAGGSGGAGDETTLLGSSGFTFEFKILGEAIRQAEEEDKSRGVTVEEYTPGWGVEQNEYFCLEAIDLINKKHAPDVYKLLEAVSNNPIVLGGFWVHINLMARCKTPDGSGDSSPKLFFVEINRITRELTSFKCLEFTGEGPDPVSGCKFCSPDAEPSIYHPGDGDFCLSCRPRDA